MLKLIYGESTVIFDFVSSILMLKNQREKLEDLLSLLLKHLWSSWLINSTPLYHSSSKVLFINFTLYWESSTVHYTLSWVFLITHSSLTDQENILQMVSAYQFFSYMPCISLFLVYTLFSEIGWVFLQGALLIMYSNPKHVDDNLTCAPGHLLSQQGINSIMKS